MFSAEGNLLQNFNCLCIHRVKPANFDCLWDISDDSALLKGIYQYGMGSWEAIKMDPSLGMSEKILASEDTKPQGKHLTSRAEYLLKIIRKNLDLKRGAPVSILLGIINVFTGWI